MNLVTNYFYTFILTNLLLISISNAKNIKYILPDESNLAQFSLQTSIKYTKNRILILTNNISYETKKLFIKRSDLNINILSNCKNINKNIFELALYKHINLNCYNNSEYELILFDNSYLCKNTKTDFFCSEEKEFIKQYKEHLEYILKSSLPYLK